GTSVPGRQCAAMAPVLWHGESVIVSHRRIGSLTKMPAARTTLTPPPIATEAFTDAAAAVARLEEIYERNTKFLRDRFEAFVNGTAPEGRVRVNYPFVRMTTSTHVRLDSRLAYGFV